MPKIEFHRALRMAYPAIVLLGTVVSCAHLERKEVAANGPAASIADRRLTGTLSPAALERAEAGRILRSLPMQFSHL